MTTTQTDPRWANMYASIGLQEITGEMLEMNLKPWVELRIDVWYKGVRVFIKRVMHPDDVKSLLCEKEIFDFILNEMVEKIDEGLNRVDAGEREFNL